MSMNSYYAGKPVAEHLDYAAKELGEAMAAVDHAIKRARQALAMDFEPLQKIEPYPLAETIGRGRYDKASLERAYQESLPLREKVAAALAHNSAIKAKLTALLTAVGLPTSEHAKSGSGYRAKTISVDAGWVMSLKKIPTYDQWPELERQYKDRLESFDREAKKAEEERTAKTRAAEKERLLLEASAIAYSVCGSTDWYEARRKVLSQSKYLNLAHAMHETRSDWSDGCYRVSDAIQNFKVETPEDAAIVTNIAAICSDFDDGRSFRDCTWNYDRLFAMVAESDPPLYQTYGKLQSFAELFR